MMVMTHYSTKLHLLTQIREHFPSGMEHTSDPGGEDILSVVISNMMVYVSFLISSLKGWESVPTTP